LRGSCADRDGALRRHLSETSEARAVGWRRANKAAADARHPPVCGVISRWTEPPYVTIERSEILAPRRAAPVSQPQRHRVASPPNAFNNPVLTTGGEMLDGVSLTEAHEGDARHTR
jgi:hypothetical protein